MLAALLGLAGIFLPFAYGISPWSALFPLTFPSVPSAALMSPLITVLAIRFAAKGSLGPVASAIAWAVAAWFLAGWGWGWYSDLSPSGGGSGLSLNSMSSVVTFCLPWLLLLFGGWVTLRAARHRLPAISAPLLALRTLYVSYTTYALSVFSASAEAGAWVILGAAAIHFYLIALAARGRLPLAPPVEGAKIE
jgi:hypothetical protein